MSSWGVLSTTQPEQQVRRVRDEVKDGVVVVCFSVAASSTVAVLLTALMKLAG